MSTTFNPHEEIDKIVSFTKEFFAKNLPNGKAVIGISGGKDSTITAALLVKALGKQRVFGVLLPDEDNEDWLYGLEAVNYLDIPSITINIHSTLKEMYDSIGVSVECNDFAEGVECYDAVLTNAPARLRMNYLYSIAAMVNGLVANTCNYSEDYVGYSTKFGDDAGDFGLLHSYTVTEVRAIGRALGLPDKLVDRVPNDGMSGKGDEEKLGFSYAELDDFLLHETKPEYEKYRKIYELHQNSGHKRETIRIPHPMRSWKFEDGCIPF